jgi:DNA-binding transcriptional MerR regulator
MGILEQITQMKNQGTSDAEIINALKEQGFPPKQINDAMNQMQIKNAVSSENMDEIQPPTLDEEEYSGNYTPSTQDISQEGYAPQDEYYPQEEGYDNYAPQVGGGTDMMIEVAEQVFSEKVKKIQDKIDELNEFKTLGEAKINNLSDRIKRIETIIDKLQMSILEKIGSYGNNIESIKKEMQMMQDSFSKVVNPLAHKTAKKHSKK